MPPRPIGRRHETGSLVASCSSGRRRTFPAWGRAPQRRRSRPLRGFAVARCPSSPSSARFAAPQPGSAPRWLDRATRRSPPRVVRRPAMPQGPSVPSCSLPASPTGKRLDGPFALRPSDTACCGEPAKEIRTSWPEATGHAPSCEAASRCARRLSPAARSACRSARMALMHFPLEKPSCSRRAATRADRTLRCRRVERCRRRSNP